MSDTSTGNGSGTGHGTSGDPGVDFPTFVASLVEGVFDAIVSASIQ